MHRVSRVFVLAAVVLSAAVEKSAAQRYVAATDETITSETEERQSDPPVHTIFILNRSTIPVTVFSVSLNGCENIKPRCGPKSTKLRVAPGQRVIAMRVEPANIERAWSYRFGFSWQADTSSGALATLAAGGDAAAQQRLAAMRRADSLRRAETGPHYHELTRDDFKAIAERAYALRPIPESLAIAPGERTSVDRLRLLVLDKEGNVLGETRWRSWRIQGQGAVEFVPNDILLARRPGRSLVHLRLSDEPQGMLATAMPDVEIPIVVAYRADPHAPVFTGRAVDADSKTPLACAQVALEDSAQNVVVSDRTDASGMFSLQAPHPGTYRVRVETKGWAPAYGPTTAANADEEKQQEYQVRFTEQLLIARYESDETFRHATPVAVAAEPVNPRPTTKTAGARTAPRIEGVTLSGSPWMPILGIVTRISPATVWAQFVVDSTGRVDATSVQLQPGSTVSMKANVMSVLPRLRFSPARNNDRPVCELVRLQVNFSPH